MSEKIKTAIIVAHPDDETVGMAGRILAERDRRDFHLLVLSDGGGGREGDEREAYIRIRRRELGEVGKVLGFAGIAQADFPDGYLDRHLKEMEDAICDFIASVNAEEIFTHYGADAHPDHRAVSAATRAAVWKARTFRGVRVKRHFEFEVWTPLQAFTELIDITEFADAKSSAIELYTSQADLALDGILGLNRYRGMLVPGKKDGPTYAEAFYEVPRSEW